MIKKFIKVGDKNIKKKIKKPTKKSVKNTSAESAKTELTAEESK